jgi:hypothetical protein
MVRIFAPDEAKNLQYQRKAPDFRGLFIVCTIDVQKEGRHPPGRFSAESLTEEK